MISLEEDQIIKDGVRALTFCPHNLGSNFRSYVRQVGLMHQLYVAVSNFTNEDKGIRRSAMEQIMDIAVSWLDGHIPCECNQVKQLLDLISGDSSGSTKPLAPKPTARADRAVQDTPETKRRKMTNFAPAFPGAFDLDIQQLCHDTIKLRIDFDQVTAQLAEIRKKCQFLEHGPFQYFAVDRIPGLPVSNREELDDFERRAASLSFRRTIKKHCVDTWEQFMIDRLFTRDFLESWRKMEETSGQTIPFATYRNTILVIRDILRLRDPNITRLQAEQKFRNYIGIALLKQQEKKE